MLKKKFSKLSALFMIGSLLLGGAFFGCSSGGGDDSTYYTVKYDAGDYAEQLTADEKASIADKRVEDGSSITLPVLTTEPETDDSAYEFKSWMDGETEVSSPYKVTKDVTLSAKWEKITSRLDNISDLASIAITQNPTVTEYGYGEKFSKNGLKVSATDSTGKTVTLASIDYTLSDVDMSQEGEQTVTVTVTKGDVTKTAEFTIKVIVVDAEWDFTTADTYSIGTDYVAVTDKDLALDSAKGASLKMSGQIKWGNGKADDKADFCMWFDKGNAFKQESDKVEGDSRGNFKITVDASAVLTVKACGNGSADVKRWLAVVDADGKFIGTALENLDSSTVQSYVGQLKKGTYTIYTSGSRVKSVKVSNKEGADFTTFTVKNTDGTDVASSNELEPEQTLVLSYNAKDKDNNDVTPTVASSNETVATATINETAKTVTITAVAAGNAAVTITSGEQTVTVNVTVAVIDHATVKLNGKAVASLEAAFAAITGNSDYTITIGTGTAKVTTGKQLKYAGTGTLTIEGDTTTEYGADVIIKGNPNTASQNSRELIYVTGNGNLVIKNVTVVNTYSLSTECQAEAIASNGSGKVLAYNCTFSSHQDTIRTTGKAWFYHCAIRGDVDFLWMELKGVVALYEDCLLTAVGDRAKGAYFVAPRANRGAKIGKGVVVLNSKLVVEDGVDAYLFRSPWDGKGSCYNQSTFVGCTIAEGSSLNSALVKNNSEGVGDNSVVGWKVDSTLAAAYKSKASNVGTLSDADKTAEYSNRGMILNRLIAIDGTTTSYVTDETGFWDVTGLIPAAETAKPTENPAIAAFDATSATVIWDFSGLTFAGAKFDSGDDASTGTTGFQSKSGTMPGVVSKDTSGENVVLMDINAASGKLAANTTNDGTAKGQSQFNANTILTVPVTNGAKVTLTTTSGAKSTWINNVQGDSGDVVYTATADGEAIIYATGTAYISKVVVENLNLTTLTEGQKNATKTGETKAVVISGDTTVKTGKSITLTAKAYGSYGAAATTFTWASSNTTIATVANGTVKGVAVGSTDITASVGSITSNKISVTVEQASANAVVLTWLNNATGSLAGASDNETLATPSDATYTQDTTNFIYKGYNSSKCDVGVTWVTTTSSGISAGAAGTGSISFTVNAKQSLKITEVTVLWGKQGSSSFRVDICNGSSTLFSGQTVTNASSTVGSKSTYTLTEPITVSSGSSATIDLKFYMSEAAAKTLSVGTVTITGEKVE